MEEPGHSFRGDRVRASGGDRHADPERLGQDERVSWLRAGVARDCRLLSGAGDRETVDGHVVLDRVAAPDDRAGLGDLLRSAPENLLEDLLRQDGRGKRDERQSEDRTRPHRVDVGERVGRGDLAEEIRVVDDRREEVDRRDEHLPVADPVHGRVVGGRVPDQQGGIRRQRELREKRGKVELTDLAGSTRARRERRERGMTRFAIRHARIMSRGPPDMSRDRLLACTGLLACTRFLNLGSARALMTQRAPRGSTPRSRRAFAAPAETPRPTSAVRISRPWLRPT